MNSESVIHWRFHCVSIYQVINGLAHPLYGKDQRDIESSHCLEGERIISEPGLCGVTRSVWQHTPLLMSGLHCDLKKEKYMYCLVGNWNNQSPWLANSSTWCDCSIASVRRIITPRAEDSAFVPHIITRSSCVIQPSTDMIVTSKCVTNYRCRIIVFKPNGSIRSSSILNSNDVTVRTKLTLFISSSLKIILLAI